MIETERLILRNYRLDDLERFWVLFFFVIRLRKRQLLCLNYIGVFNLNYKKLKGDKYGIQN